MLREKFITALTVCTAAFGIHASSFAQETVSEIPQNLAPAEAFDEQVQGDAQLLDVDGLRPGPGHGGYHSGHGHYHRYPVPRPYPRPYPRPVPMPYPRSVFVTCYAQSPANGLIYAASARLASHAQNRALLSCYNATGYACVARGCRY